MPLPLAAAGAAAGRAAAAGVQVAGKTAATAGKIGARAVKKGVQTGTRATRQAARTVGREVKQRAQEKIRERLEEELSKKKEGGREPSEQEWEGTEEEGAQEPPTPEELYERRKQQLEALRQTKPYIYSPRRAFRSGARVPLGEKRFFRVKEIPGIGQDTLLPALRRAQLSQARAASAARARGRIGGPSKMAGKGGIMKGAVGGAGKLAGRAGVAGAAAMGALKGAQAMKRFFPPLGGRRPQKAAARKGGGPTLLSPEGVAMLTTAVFWDFAPLLITIPLDLLFDIGEIVDWIPDILATLTLGFWMYIRSGEMAFGKKLSQFLQKRGMFMAMEFIPHVGWIPWWTINVFFFLKK